MNICYGSYSQALHVALTLPAVHKSTGCADLLSTKVYRLCRLTTNKGLSTVQTCHTSLPAVQKSTGCSDLPYKFTGCSKVHRLYTSLPAVQKSTGRPQVYQLHRLATSLPAVQKSTGCSVLPHKSTVGPGRSFSGCLRVVNSL